MSDKIEYSRLLMKRSTSPGEVPTVPPITATTLNQFTPTDVFVGEFFLNAADDLLWIRTDNGIFPIELSGSSGTTSVGTLTEVLYEGNVTGGFDIEVSSGDTIIFSGLTTGTSQNLLAVDTDGRTIIVTGTTGGSGTSGTSGTDGTSGTSGISGSSGTSGVNGDAGTSGTNGTSGTSGISGATGTSGTSGTDGSSGTSATGSTQNLSQVLSVGNQTGPYNIEVEEGYRIKNYSGQTNDLDIQYGNSDGSLVLSVANGISTTSGYTSYETTGIFNKFDDSISQANIYNTGSNIGLKVDDTSQSFISKLELADTSDRINLSEVAGSYIAEMLVGAGGTGGGWGLIPAIAINTTDGTQTSNNYIDYQAGVQLEHYDGTNYSRAQLYNNNVNIRSIGAVDLSAYEMTDAEIKLVNQSGTSIASQIKLNVEGIDLTVNPTAYVTISGLTAGITTGQTSTFITIDPTNRRLYTTTGTTGGGSGTSGTSGINGTSGTNGANGSSGTSGTSGGGGGGGSITITGVTLTQTGWTYNAPYYEYEYTNSAITASVAVLFTPYNSSVSFAVGANIYPYIELVYSDNKAIITADYQPIGDITGQLVIF